MRIVAIDGRSGAGKTELADRLVASLGASVVRLEDHYEGWEGLTAGIHHVRGVLESMRSGREGAAPTWDWVAGAPGALRTYSPGEVVIVEGVGAGALDLEPYVDLLVWIEAPDALRKERALARDGDTFAPWWDVWAHQEDEYLAKHRPQDRAVIRHVA